MKKFILLLGIVILSISCKQEEPLPPNTYEITISAKGVVNGLRSYIKIIDEKRKETFIDTAIVMNEAFTFSGNVSNPVLRIISINSINGDLPFVLEPGRTSIELYKDSIFFSKVEGSKNNVNYNVFKDTYRNKVNAIKKVRGQALEAKSKGNLELFGELKAKDPEMQDDLNNYAHNFIEDHPKSDFSLLLLENQIRNRKFDLERFKNSLKVLEDVIDKNEANKAIAQNIEEFITAKEAHAFLDIGKIAPNFTAPSAIDDEVISLNDIKGRATIIDFWASWCGPCRRENPNVVKVYEKYHDKGLEIISVSLDKPGQKERWLKAIADDKLNWHHVSNLKYFNDPVAKMYNINSIPATFILDEEGKIVAKKLRGEALGEKISELLD